MTELRPVKDESKEKDYQTFEEDSDDKHLLGYTVDEAINHIGFGRAQLRLVFMTGFAWLADGMEIMVLSILGPTLTCAWGINPWQSAFLTTIVFLGFLIGSWLFGFVADHIGRRKSLLVSSLVALFFGVASGLSLDYYWLVLFRFGVGFGVGGAPQAVTYYAEFLPMDIRGKLIMLIELFFAAGGFIEVLLAIIILEPLGWRWWIILTAAPLVLFIIFCFFIPKSPRYLLACGKNEEAKAVLAGLAKENGTTLPPGELLPEQEVKRGRLSDMFVPKYRLTSILLAIIWFASAFSYYGIILLTTELISSGTNCPKERLSPESANTSVNNCNPLTNDDYVELLWTSSAEVPGLLLTAVFIDIFGRRLLLGVDYIMFTISCFILCICMAKTPMIAFLFLARAIISSSFQICFVYTPEVYPTQVRALSVGLGSGCARIGALITPYIAEVLTKVSTQWSLTIYASVSVVTTISSFLLPIETKGQQLEGATNLKKEKSEK